ncbi:MAG: type II-A CRISPR-associated protein Csn2 [Clostridia bacterium]
MIFATDIFNESFISKENEIPILVIENKKMYQNFIFELISELNGIESEHNFFIDDKQLNLRKDLELILDMFTLDINKSKNITKLYNYIKSEYINNEKLMQTTQLSVKIIEYIQDITNEIDFDLTFETNIDLQAILKAVDLKFYYDDSTLLEKLIDYIKITHDFLGKKFFIILNLKTIFSSQEQQQFYEFLMYNKIEILLVETSQQSKKLENEIYRIIDDDLCVIY